MGAPDGLDQALPTVATGAIPALPSHLERYREKGLGDEGAISTREAV